MDLRYFSSSGGYVSSQSIPQEMSTFITYHVDSNDACDGSTFCDSNDPHHLFTVKSKMVKHTYTIMVVAVSLTFIVRLEDHVISTSLLQQNEGWWMLVIILKNNRLQREGNRMNKPLFSETSQSIRADDKSPS